MDHALKGGSMMIGNPVFGVKPFNVLKGGSMIVMQEMMREEIGDLRQDLKEARQLYKDAKARITQLEEQNRWLAQNFNKYAREFDRIFSENATFDFKNKF